MPETKLIVKNKKAYFDYEIVETWEAGVELKWHETKSVRSWHVNLKWAFLIIQNQELFVKNIPLELYFSWSLIKMRVWLAKWRKTYQKKQVLKERTMEKEAKLAMKKYL